MKNSPQIDGSLAWRESFFLLIQFFLIIFVYHTLKDLKDTVVITASSAGAEVIPFIKIWGMLPLALAASYLFLKIYNRFGREKTLYFITGALLFFYCTFAFLLFPLRDALYLSRLDSTLTILLPVGCRGFIAMICYWHYTLFYLAAELWSVLVLSILFWGYVNETMTLQKAKEFYPLCMFTGNFAGILSGQTSHYLSHHLREYLSWQETVQMMIGIVTLCGLCIASINRWALPQSSSKQKLPCDKASLSFKDDLLALFRSGPVLCIAALVIGFGLTSNLIEVVWKENIRKLYPEPQSYNAYINQLTSLIGISAVCMAFLSKWIFKWLSWGKVALITPVILFMTSFIFFAAILLPSQSLAKVYEEPLFLIVILGSIHYVCAMTAKYTLFDTCKEMAFLSLPGDERIKAKSVIDSVGSRFGKTGSSCLYQFLLITFGSTAGHLPFIGFVSLAVMAVSILAAKQLGGFLSDKSEWQSSRAL